MKKDIREVITFTPSTEETKGGKTLWETGVEQAEGETADKDRQGSDNGRRYIKSQTHNPKG